MDKTLRKKLTGEYQNAHAVSVLSGLNGDDLSGAASGRYGIGLTHEMNLLREAAKDLLQPRPEAIDRLLKLAKEI